MFGCPQLVRPVSKEGLATWLPMCVCRHFQFAVSCYVMIVPSISYQFVCELCGYISSYNCRMAFIGIVYHYCFRNISWSIPCIFQQLSPYNLFSIVFDVDYLVSLFLDFDYLVFLFLGFEFSLLSSLVFSFLFLQLSYFEPLACQRLVPYESATIGHVFVPISHCQAFWSRTI